ncbi:hypothetical protein EDB83DRAFT_2402363 [Lactarius deliciosus]|nr:hypothetical protein EDB83DRAFT_2402363 [Lactarius deliciosus]
MSVAISSPLKYFETLAILCIFTSPLVCDGSPKGRPAHRSARLSGLGTHRRQRRVYVERFRVPHLFYATSAHFCTVICDGDTFSIFATTLLQHQGQQTRT